MQKTLAFALLLVGSLSFAHAAQSDTATGCEKSYEKVPLPTAANIYSWTFPQQLVGYRNMEKIFPYRVSKRGATVAELPKAASELPLSYEVAGERWNADRFMKENRAAGLIILHKGSVVLERYCLGYGPDERWTSFSVAKSVTSTLAGAAVKDGSIRSLDDPVVSYLPALKGTAFEGVTVRRVLTMTSGIKWNENYLDPNSDSVKIRAERSINGSDPIVSYMARLTREAEPGKKFAYKTGETHLLGAIVRAATKKTLSDYLSEKIWSKVGMQNDAYWMLDTGRHELAGSGLSASLRDFARFGQFFLGKAMVDGKSIVPDSWPIEAITPTAASRETDGSGYGYQWWVMPGGDTFRGIGIFGQMIFLDPARDLVIATNSAWPSPTDSAGVDRWSALIRAVSTAIPVSH